MAVIDMTIDVGIDGGEPVLTEDRGYVRRYAAEYLITFGGGQPVPTTVHVEETRDATGRTVRTVLFPAQPGQG